ncbi:hypothetical protein DFH08DRAFT_951074 [Mycena albidolilacea]|uniref:Uncharacterized protein n=1 Tax=Mycena albidolilacea TaxID=1033008 RepID=A0AAD7AMI4_9AGAR|nr:hypothetical protein DFH08DRAFT_951074 [Mycena albidolilacea]
MEPRGRFLPLSILGSPPSFQSVRSPPVGFIYATVLVSATRVQPHPLLRNDIAIRAYCHAEARVLWRRWSPLLEYPLIQRTPLVLFPMFKRYSLTSCVEPPQKRQHYIVTKEDFSEIVDPAGELGDKTLK